MMPAGQRRWSQPPCRKGNFMPDIGIPELLIILVIVLVLFGPGRLAGAGGALGQAIREFRQGLQDEDENTESIPAEPGPDKQINRT